MPISSHDRIELLQTVSHNWLQLRNAISTLSDEQMMMPATIGEWSVKDILAHLAAWDRVAIERIDAAERGEAPQRFDDGEVEARNRETAEESEEYDLADVLEDLDDTHEELMHAIETSPEVRPSLIRASTYEHYAEHAEDLRDVAHVTAKRPQ